MTSFGEHLRRERELRGISLRELADATKISVRFLQAIEQDRMDVLPGGLFRRAFVRQYAKHVGLDPERVVAEFVYAHGDETPPGPPAAPSRRQPPQGALLALGVALLGGWLLFTREDASRRGEEVELPPPPPATLPLERVISGAGPNESLTPSPDGLVLTLSASQDCWVMVQVDGQPVLNRVLAAGETETLEAGGEIVLSVGNAGGLSFRVNDRQGLPLGRQGEVKRNIVITEENLPALLQDSPGAATDGSHS